MNKSRSNETKRLKAGDWVEVLSREGGLGGHKRKEANWKRFLHAGDVPIFLRSEVQDFRTR